MVVLLLVRHGETVANSERRIQGQLDEPLSPTGRAQAMALAERLAAVTLHRCIASDLSRAVETAALLTRPHRIPVEQDSRLREIHYGILQGRTFAEAQELVGQDRWPDRTRVPAAIRANPPGGESEQAVIARLQSFLHDLQQTIASAPNDEIMLIVAHGGSLRYLLCLLLALPARAADAFPFANCALTCVRWQPGQPAQLLTHNDCCHLHNGKAAQELLGRL
ncbi:histidine phosphatase family protein [Thermorudis peleae]|uniref:histidine phosphatase family protein n=1 Tax=Thermorudis peleae TaxID=1382356 RepID=UPI00068B93FB|nr:histidine phosphatase family protein [Thermorudis peleae]